MYAIKLHKLALESREVAKRSGAESYAGKRGFQVREPLKRSASLSGRTSKAFTPPLHFLSGLLKSAFLFSGPGLSPPPLSGPITKGGTFFAMSSVKVARG